MNNYFIFFLFVTILSFAQTQSNTCGCLLYVFKDGVSNALVTQVLSFVIPDFGQQTQECNENTVNKCTSICTERVSYLTNNMDLEKQPKGDLHIVESFGQFVCNKFAHDIENETLGVFSYTHCNELHTVHGVNVSTEHTQTQFTGLMSQNYITCKNAKFIAQSKEGLNTGTTIEMTTTPTTSPKLFTGKPTIKATTHKN